MFRSSHLRKCAVPAAGHTLMELMVVMALLAIAASLLLPITVHAYARFKLRLAADSIARLMQQARNRALFEGHTYFVIFPEPGAADRELVLTREDGASVGHCTYPNDVSLTIRRGEDDWSNDIGFVTFYPDGTSDAIQLALKNASNTELWLQLDPVTARATVVLRSEREP